MSAAENVVPFPTRRKRPYPTTRRADAATLDGVVSICEARNWARNMRRQLAKLEAEAAAERASQPLGMISVEEALSTALLTALCVGNQRDRSLFQLVGWELSRMLERRPASDGLRGAMSLWKSIDQVNESRRGC